MIRVIINRSFKPKEKKLVEAVLSEVSKGQEYIIEIRADDTFASPKSEDVYLILGDIQIGSKSKKVKGKVVDDPIYLDKHKWVHGNMIPNYTPSEVLQSPGKFLDFYHNFEKAFNFKEHQKLEKLAATPTDIRVWDSLESFLNHVDQFTEFDCDIETRGFDFINDAILLIGFCVDDHSCDILPADVYYKASNEIKTRFKLFMEDPDNTFAWTNGKFDIKFFRTQLGIKARVDEDLVLMNYAMDERKGIHSLEYQSQDVLNVPDYKGKISFETVDMYDKDFIEYLGKDCRYQRLTRKFKYEKLKTLPESLKLYRKILLPGSELLANVEMNGFYVDVEYAKALQKEYQKKIDVAFDNIIKVAVNEAGFDGKKYADYVGSKTIPDMFNPKSPKQLGYVLLDLLKLPKHKNRRSTDAKAIGYWLINTLNFPADNMDNFAYVDQEVIDRWLSEGDKLTRNRKLLVYTLVEYRSLTKLKSTYIDVVLEKRSKENRIHASFNLNGTVTGRLSSSGPNLQNIPRKKEIKNMFSAPEGYTLAECDYSQAELRVLAYLSQDPVILGSYRDGKDLHDAVATQIYGPNFTKEQRVGAKTINFGLAYGRGVPSIAEQLGMSISEAQKLYDDWFNNMPVAGNWIKSMRNSPYGDKPLTTVFGRTRRLGLTNRINANSHENESVNFPIQSTASDLTLLSAMAVQKWLEENDFDAKIVNIVHDAILVQIKDEHVDKVVPVVKKIMEETPQKVLDNCNLPFKADAEITKKGWGSKEKYVGGNDD